LNEKVLPIFAEEQLPMLRNLTDRGTEYCGRAETHDYQLYLAINDIEHSKIKVRNPQTNGICERFHKTLLQEFYQVALRKTCITSWRPCKKTWTNGSTITIISEPRLGKICCGRTTMATLQDGKTIWKEKLIG
jgi:transposase InsO family protein